MLFTFYLVADGPKMRRAICSRFTPARQERILATWELAGNKTGGYLYSRALLALLSAIFHWIVFQAVGTPAPVALALWVGVISQFLPVVGTYIAGALPVLLTFLESPVDALIVLIAIVVYQQIENYLFSPRITARTMELHPALAFGAALAGAAVLGGVGAILALPAAAMVQALISQWGAPPPGHQERADRGAPPPGLQAMDEDHPAKRGRRLSDAVLARPDRRRRAQRRRGERPPRCRRGARPGRHRGVVGRRSRRRVYARSALKPLQAAAMVAGGLSARRPAAGASSAPATTGGRSTSPPSRRSSPVSGSAPTTSRTRPTLPLDPDAHADGGPGRCRRRRRSCRTAAASTPGCWPRRSSTGGRRPGTRRRTTRCSGRSWTTLRADGRTGRPRRCRRLRRTGADGLAARPGERRPSARRRRPRRASGDDDRTPSWSVGRHRDVTRADAARAGPAGQGRRRRRAGRGAARRAGGRPQDRRRCGAGAGSGDRRRAALARCRPRAATSSSSRCSATVEPVGSVRSLVGAP